ncbi:MAG: hypothetical protein ACOYBQ_09915 [Fluviibacter sp.]
MTQENEKATNKTEQMMDEYQRFFVPSKNAVSLESHARFEIFSAYPEKEFVMSNQASPRRTRRA